MAGAGEAARHVPERLALDRAMCELHQGGLVVRILHQCGELRLCSLSAELAPTLYRSSSFIPLSIQTPQIFQPSMVWPRT